MGFLDKETIGFSGHGFRATASTMLNETGCRPDVIERRLAHEERNKTRASYNRATYLPERKTMMQAWTDTVDEILQPSTIPTATNGHATTGKGLTQSGERLDR
jgi:hypothetical protein